MRLRLIAVLVACAAVAASTAANASTTETRRPKVYTRGVEQMDLCRYAVVLGEVENYGLPTRYRFKWGRTKKYGHRAENQEIVEYDGAHPVFPEAVIEPLQPNKVYHYRLVAWNQGGKAEGGDRSFRAASC